MTDSRVTRSDQPIWSNSDNLDVTTQEKEIATFVLYLKRTSNN